MSKYSKHIGLVLGLLVYLILKYANLPGEISPKGQTCLALTLMVVVWWAFQIAQSGFTSGIYLVLLTVMGVADLPVIFSGWTGPTMYLVLGAYLIAEAVKESRLGERIAYKIIIKFVTNYKSIIVSIFLITFILSLLIPQPWPRAFLIMAVMKVLIDSAKIPKVDAVKIGFAVFAAAVPISLIFLTGDAAINPVALANAGIEVSWLEWLKFIGVPAAIGSIITMFLILILFKPSREVVVDKAVMREKLASMGKLTKVEIRTIIWLVIAVAFWLTDSVHGIHIGWITFMIPMLMSLPVVGGVLTAKSWKSVPVHVLIFLTAAMAIGKVAGTTGMSSWLVSVLMPENMSDNVFVLAILLTVLAILGHMLLGSAIAVMGVLIPPVIAMTASMGINPLVPTVLVFYAIASHYILPFQHLSVLVGSGEENGMYGQKETIRLGLPLTVVVFVVNICIMVPWLMLMGVI